MATISSNLFKGLLLDYYYKRRAESECMPLSTRFLLTEAWLGQSSYVRAASSGSGFDIANISPTFTMSELTDVFARVALHATVDANANMNITVQVKDTDITLAGVHKFNTLVLVDTDGQACAVLCCQEDTVYKGKNFTAYITIEQKVI